MKRQLVVWRGGEESKKRDGGDGTHLDVDRADGDEDEKRVRDASNPAIEASSHVLEEKSVPDPEEDDTDHLEGTEAVGLGLGSELLDSQRD